MQAGQSRTVCEIAYFASFLQQIYGSDAACSLQLLFLNRKPQHVRAYCKNVSEILRLPALLSLFRSKSSKCTSRASFLYTGWCNKSPQITSTDLSEFDGEKIAVTLDVLFECRKLRSAAFRGVHRGTVNGLIIVSSNNHQRRGKFMSSHLAATVTLPTFLSYAIGICNAVGARKNVASSSWGCKESGNGGEGWRC
jgi:hypothetical protein